MWVTYREIASNFFKNATFLVDKYHWVRQTIWAFEAVRKEVQKQLRPDIRKYFIVDSSSPYGSQRVVTKQFKKSSPFQNCCIALQISLEQ